MGITVGFVWGENNNTPVSTPIDPVPLTPPLDPAPLNGVIDLAESTGGAICALHTYPQIPPNNHDELDVLNSPKTYEWSAQFRHKVLCSAALDRTNLPKPTLYAKGMSKWVWVWRGWNIETQLTGLGWDTRHDCWILLKKHHHTNVLWLLNSSGEMEEKAPGENEG